MALAVAVKRKGFIFTCPKRSFEFVEHAECPEIAFADNIVRMLWSTEHLLAAATKEEYFTCNFLDVNEVRSVEVVDMRATAQSCRRARRR